MEAPSIVVSEKLATREAQNVVFVSPEEVLNIRQPAYTKSTTEIAWLLRQPSAASICVNQPYIQLEIEYELQKAGAGANAHAAIAANDLDVFPLKTGKSAFGEELEGFPFQSTCVRASVFTVNGASTTYRNSEFCKEYLRANTSRAFMKRMGNEWNEYADTCVTAPFAANNQYTTVANDSLRVPGFDEASRRKKWEHNVVGYNAKFELGANGKTRTMYYREPLFLSIFGGLLNNSEHPLWSCEGNKSPTLLHMSQLQISMSLHDNWYQNLFGLIQTSSDNQIHIKNAVIKKALLCCTFVSPPPKYVSSALSSQVSYACMKTLRFKMNPAAPGTVAPLETRQFTLDATSFPYMPSCFMINVAPDYNSKINYACAASADAAEMRAIRESKKDKRFMISRLNLTVNTSPDVIPAVGGASTADAGRHQLTYNARQLYEFYKENTSHTECLYDFNTWRESACCVIITSEQMSGILASSSIKGNVTISGSIEAVNTMGYSVYIGDANPVAIGADIWETGKKLERYNAQIVGIFSNQYVSVDSRSAIVGESVLSEQFGASLRLS